MKKGIKGALLGVMMLSMTTMAVAQSANRSLNRFDEIKLSGPFNVSITMGTTESVKIDASPEDLNEIEVIQTNETIRIQARKQSMMQKSHHFGKVNIAVSAQQLKEIEIMGSGDVVVLNELNANELELEITGSGNISADQLNVRKLESKIVGSGDITVKGKATKSEIKLSSAGNYSGQDLVSVECDVEISGSGNAKVHATGRLEGKVSGSGNIRYKGSPSIDSKLSGTGKLLKL